MYIINCTKHLLQANTSILPRIPKNIEIVRNRTMSGIGPTTVHYPEAIIGSLPSGQLQGGPV